MKKEKQSDGKVREKCYFCGKGILEKKRVTVDFRWGDKLMVIEKVPAKVCNECGEKYYSAEVSREMERIIKEDIADHEMKVPVAKMGL